MNTNQATTSHERAVTAASGWVMLPTLIVLFIGDVALILLAIKDGVETTGQPHFGLLIPSLLLLPILSVMLSGGFNSRSEEHTSELQSPMYLVCRLLLEKKK